MSMEPSSWVVPCYSGWSMEEAAAWSSEDRISFQTSLPSHSDSGMQLQMVEYAAPATPTPTNDNDCSDPTIQVFKEAVDEVHASYLQIMQVKMHKFPPSLVDVHPRYTVPVSVAIGPYHHGHPGMMEAEKMKIVAADQCVRDSRASLQEMYNAVFAVLPDALYLYYKDELEGFWDDDFLPMMFLDACFLVQFMRWFEVDDDDMDQVLVSYFSANCERICTDIMMLENQIPWVVVKTIISFMPPAPSSSPWLWEMFITAMGSNLKNRMGSGAVQDMVVIPEYEPPHLLGLFRFCIVGNNKDDKNLKLPTGDKPMSLSISVAELAGVGITVLPREKIEAGLVDMGFRKKWPFFGVLVLPPLRLTEANATWLVNMAAFELCETPDFEHDDIGAGNSAVCSYLQLFTMLMDQEKHVHELRENRVIEGGGLTSKETLEFFTSIGKNLRVGKSYLKVIIEIDEFKRKRSFLLKAYLFLMKHWTKIIAVTTVIGAVAGILSSLQNLKTKQPKT